MSDREDQLRSQLSTTRLAIFAVEQEIAQSGKNEMPAPNADYARRRLKNLREFRALLIEELAELTRDRPPD